MTACAPLAAVLVALTPAAAGCAAGAPSDHDADGRTKEQREFARAHPSHDEQVAEYIRNSPRPPIVPSRLLDVTTAELERTVVVPHTRSPIPEGKNALWCATWQLAWDALCDGVAKGPVTLDAPAPAGFAEEMNRRTFPHDALEPASFLAMAGRERDGILPGIRNALRSRFGVTMRGEPAPGTPVDAVAYAYLRKSLPFERRFEPNPAPISFAGGERRVLAFGLHHESVHPDGDAIMGQVRVLHEKPGKHEYDEPEEFVLEFAVKGGKDRLIVACVPRASTLHAAWEGIRPAVEAGGGEPLRKGITLVVPKMNFDLHHSFDEILGAPTRPDIGPIGFAMQTVRFSLDEGGALLESHAIVPTLGLSSAYTVDRPFLLALLETGKRDPYLLLRVENDELLAVAAE